MDPFTTKQQGKFAAPQALEAAIRVLRENAQQCRRPFVPEEFSGCVIFQDGIHGFKFALLATDTCPFGPGAPPPDRRPAAKSRSAAVGGHDEVGEERSGGIAFSELRKPQGEVPDEARGKHDKGGAHQGPRDRARTTNEDDDDELHRQQQIPRLRDQAAEERRQQRPCYSGIERGDGERLRLSPRFGDPHDLGSDDGSWFGVHLVKQGKAYYLLLFLVIVFALLAKNMMRTRMGRSWASIRDRDIAAEIMGVAEAKGKTQGEPPAVVIGGLDSIVGAIVGGLIVGLVEVFVGSYAGGVSWLGIGFAGVVPWLLMMAVLLVKPYGIFGTEEVRRV